VIGPPTKEIKVDLLFIFHGAKYFPRWRLLCMTHIYGLKNVGAKCKGHLLLGYEAGWGCR